MQALYTLRPVLGRRPLGLVFDIDGTLSPIALTPAAAQLHPAVAPLLEEARRQAQVHVVIMTGRAIDSGAAMVDIEGITYIGSHGLEWSDGLPATHTVHVVPEAKAYIKPGQHLLQYAEHHLSQLPGIIVEHKRIGGSIHYRQTPDPDQARATILSLLEGPAQEANLRLSEGKRVIEIKTPLLVNKGRALRSLTERFHLGSVVFAGDDRTDLDAILETKQLRQEGLSAAAIAVQHPDTLPELLEQADIVVQEVDGMVELLKEIVQNL